MDTDDLAHHRALSVLGGPETRFALASFSSAFLLIRRLPWSAATLMTAVLGGATINTLLKNLVRRQRPEMLAGIDQASGYSFPSGHTTGSFVFFGTLSYLLWNQKRRRSIAVGGVAISIVTTALVGRSRVALQQHHQGDVLAGYAVGAGWLAVVLGCFARPLKRESG